MTNDLKTQFLNHMALQRFSHHTKNNYMRGIEGLAKFHKQSPDTLTNDQSRNIFFIFLKIVNFPGERATTTFQVFSAFTGTCANGTRLVFKFPLGPGLRNCP